jgi:hypothetical protein
MVQYSLRHFLSLILECRASSCHGWNPSSKSPDAERMECRQGEITFLSLKSQESSLHVKLSLHFKELDLALPSQEKHKWKHLTNVIDLVVYSSL